MQKITYIQIVHGFVSKDNTGIKAATVFHRLVTCTAAEIEGKNQALVREIGTANSSLKHFNIKALPLDIGDLAEVIIDRTDILVEIMTRIGDRGQGKTREAKTGTGK